MSEDTKERFLGSEAALPSKEQILEGLGISSSDVVADPIIISEIVVASSVDVADDLGEEDKPLGDVLAEFLKG